MKIKLACVICIGLAVFLACKDGSSSSSPENNFSLPTHKGSLSSNPLVVYYGRTVDLVVPLVDSKQQVQQISILPSSPPLTVTVASGGVISGDANTGYTITGLSNPNSDGHRDLKLQIALAQANGNFQQVSRLDIRFGTGDQQSASTSTTYFRPAKLPAAPVLTENNHPLSTDKVLYSEITRNITQTVSLSSDDPDQALDAFRLTFENSALKLGTSDKVKAGGSAGVYLITPVHQKGISSQSFEIITPNNKIKSSILVEAMLDGSPVQPKSENTYYLSITDLPSSIDLQKGGTSVGSSTLKLAEGANSLVVIYSDPLKMGGSLHVAFGGSSSGYTISGTGVSSSADGGYSITGASDPSGSAHERRTTLSVTVGSSAHLDQPTTMTVEVLDASGHSFPSQVMRSYNLLRAHPPSGLAASSNAGTLSQSSSAPLVLPPGQDYTLTFNVTDQDRLISKLALTASSAGFHLQGSNLSGDATHGYTFTGLSAPDSSGKRQGSLTFNLASSLAASATLSLQIAAHAASGAPTFSPAVSTSYYFKRQPVAPTFALRTADNTELAEKSPTVAPESFIGSKSHQLSLYLVDPDAQAKTAVIEVSNSGFTFAAGSGVTMSSSGSTYTVTVPAATSGGTTRTAALTLDINSSTVTPLEPIDITVTLKKNSGADFSPTLQKVYSVQRDILTNWQHASLGSGRVFVLQRGDWFFVGTTDKFEVAKLAADAQTYSWVHRYTATQLNAASGDHFNVIAFDGNSQLFLMANDVQFGSNTSTPAKIIPATLDTSSGAVTAGSSISGKAEVYIDAQFVENSDNSYTMAIMTGNGFYTAKMNSAKTNLAPVSTIPGSGWNVTFDKNVVYVAKNQVSTLRTSVLEMFTVDSSGKLSPAKESRNNFLEIVHTAIVDDLIILADKDNGVFLGELTAPGSISWLRHYTTSNSALPGDKLLAIDVIDGKYLIAVIIDYGLALGVLDKTAKTISWKAAYPAGKKDVPSPSKYQRFSADKILTIGLTDGGYITAVIDD